MPPDRSCGAVHGCRYNESYGGVTDTSINQFLKLVPATWPNGSLLHWVSDLPDPRPRAGQGDDQVMAYSYRLCLTNNPSNRVAITPPPGYFTEQYELSARYIRELGTPNYKPWGNLPYSSYPPADKFDACCGSGPVGIDATTLNIGYSNGSYAERARLDALHRQYVLGLAWYWMGDPKSAVPEDERKAMAEYGLCADSWRTWCCRAVLEGVGRVAAPDSLVFGCVSVTLSFCHSVILPLCACS